MSETRTPVNPILASIRATKKYGFDPSLVNQVCYSVCSAYQNDSDVWDLTGSCPEMCKEANIALRPGGECAHLPYAPPVMWNQTPNVFPKCYRQTGDIPRALQMSKAMCASAVYPKQCYRNAVIQSYAVGGDAELKEDYEALEQVNISEISRSFAVILLILGLLLWGGFKAVTGRR